MKKVKNWSWAWPEYVHVSHGYAPLSVIIWLSLLFPVAMGHWVGHVVEGFKQIIH